MRWERNHLRKIYGTATKYIPFGIFPTRCNITQFIYFWKTSLHISTHHQEHTQLYLQYLVLVTHTILGHAATPPHKKLWHNLTECFNINITLARLNCKPLMMIADRNMLEPSNFNVNCNQSFNICASVGEWIVCIIIFRHTLKSKSKTFCPVLLLGPEHMPQIHRSHVRLLRYSRTILVFQTFPLSPPVHLLIRVTRETPSSERWNYVGKNHGR